MGLLTGSGRVVVTGSRLAAGGQGEVFAVSSHPGMVLKRYLPRMLAGDRSLERRLRVMTGHVPDHWREDSSGHLTLAWPAEVVREDGRFTGFLMPVVDMEQTVGLHRITNPTDRRSATGHTSWARAFTWRYLVRAAANLAQATAGLHRAGVVIGDFNDSNIRVWREARITLLDCDSMQIRDPDTGERFLCRVGRPEFTPPELVHADWAITVRHPSSDLFALAIHVYQLLLEGEHPFRGVWHGDGDKPAVPELASQGIWANHGGGMLTPRRAAISVTLLPPEILGMFRQAFEDGAISPLARPTAAAWHTALEALDAQLRTCAASSVHVYPAFHQSCPWCEYSLPPAQALLPLRSASAGQSWYWAVRGPAAPVSVTVPAGPAAPAGTIPGQSIRPRRWPKLSRSSWVAAGIAILTVAGIFFRAHYLSGSQTTVSAPVLGPPPLRTFHGNGLSLTSLAFSPSGATVATGNVLGTTGLWNVADGSRLPALADPHMKQAGAQVPSVTSVAFSPSGTTLAAGYSNGTVVVWDLATRQITTRLTDPRDAASSSANQAVQLDGVAFSPDGATIAAGDSDGTTYLWSGATGQLTGTLTDPKHPRRSIRALAFSPSGTVLATADGDGYCYLWNLPARRIATVITSTYDPNAVAFSPTGSMLATGEPVARAELWNAATGRRIRSLRDPSEPGVTVSSSVNGVAFSPNGMTLATADADGYTYLWDAATGHVIGTFTDPKNGYQDATSVAFSPYGELLATGDATGNTYLWELPKASPRTR